jgi:hypothetical protein
MFGAIPGKDVFWPWLKGIIGNLIAFPTVLLLLIIYIEFTGKTTGSAAVTVSGGSEGGFMPPFLLGNGTAPDLIGPLLGLAIILGLPDIVKEVKKAAGAGDGGIGSMLAGFAWGGLKAGWSGKAADGTSLPFGISGRGLVKTGAILGGTAAAVPITAALGAKYAPQWGYSRAQGAAAGATAPIAAITALGPGRAIIDKVGGGFKSLRKNFQGLQEMQNVVTTTMATRNNRPSSSTTSQPPTATTPIVAPESAGAQADVRNDRVERL